MQMELEEMEATDTPQVTKFKCLVMMFIGLGQWSRFAVNQAVGAVLKAESISCRVSEAIFLLILETLEFSGGD
jgi:hypothetical protein